MTKIKITDKAGVTLKTAGKYCSEDIGVTIDESLLGGGIIEVDELPTENIDENAIYKVKKKMTDAYIGTFYMKSNVSELVTLIGTAIVETKPTSNIVESNLTSAEMFLYYVPSENDIFIYANMGTGSTWYSAGLVVGQLNSALVGLSFKGETEYGNVIPSVISGDQDYSDYHGYYAIISEEKQYKYVNGNWNIITSLSRSEDLMKLMVNEIEEVTIPKSINVIPERFCTYKSKLKKLTLEEGIIRIMEYAFSTCSTLEYVKLPNSLIEIKNGAFESCYKLKSIVIPNKIIELRSHTFEQCSDLSSIVLPKTIIRIYSNTFSGCTSLTDVYYAGTEEEWNAIDIQSDEYLTSATIHYNYVEE